VFHFLAPTDLLKCCLVCRHWNNRANTRLDDLKCLTLTINSKQLRKIEENKFLLRRKYRSLKVVNSLFKEGLEYSHTTMLPDVERLVLYGCHFDSLDNFQDSWMHYEKLKVLEVVGAELENAKLGKLKRMPGKKPIKLEFFKFNMREPKEATRVSCNAKSWYCVQLFKMLKIQIVAIELGLDLDKFAKFEHLQSVLNFYHETFPKQLISLSIFGGPEDMPMGRRDFMFNSMEPVLKQKHTAKILSHLESLKYLKLVEFSADSIYHDEDMEGFLKLQGPTMTRLALNKYVNPRDQLDSIFKHCKNLTALELTFDDLSEYNSPFYNKRFNEMPHLKVLKLRSVQCATLELALPKQLEELYAHSDFTYCYRIRPSRLKLEPTDYKLPKMRIFSVINVRISSNRLQEVFAKMPNLTHFRLQDLQGSLPARTLCGHTIYGHLPFSLKNLGRLEHLSLDGRLLKDYVLQEIRSSRLCELTISYEKKKEKRVSFVKKHSPGEGHL
jgi:hypothetical protein